MPSINSLYVVFFKQCYCPAARFLAVCNNFGEIVVFDLCDVLSEDQVSAKKLPKNNVKVSQTAVYTVITYGDQCVYGDNFGRIRAIPWSDLLSPQPSSIPKAKWGFQIPADTQRIVDPPEVNCLKIEHTNNKLFTGSGDNLVHIWDLNEGRKLSALRAHTDYIHSIALSGTDMCYSGSEDGSVCIWDLRSSFEPINRIKPSDNVECNRPQRGSWIGCLDVTTAGDFLVCGGGPHLSLWHLPSMKCSSILKAGNLAHSTVQFHDDSIISGGEGSNVFYWDYDGKLKHKIPIHAPHVFSASYNYHSDKYKVLTVAGASPSIDLCTSPSYSSFTLNYQ